MRRFSMAVAALCTVILSGCGYNALQTRDEQVKAAWSEVLNQYQRRADLVPNLVNTVKGFAQQEKQVFTQVTEARSRVGSIQATPELVDDPEAFAKFQAAQRELGGALSRLLVVAESYPQLKSDANFRDLQAPLEGTELRKGAQIAVLMVPSTAPEPIEQYSLRVVERWKLGRKKVDDGALLIVAKDDRALRIEVGYGLEGVLNDATAKRIVSDIIAPRFRDGDFYGGVNAGVDAMMGVIEGELLPAPKKAAPSEGGSVGQALPILLILAVVAGGLLRATLGR